MKHLAFSDDARTKLAAGVSKLSKAVKATIGPRGRNVVLAHRYGAPQIVNDGVTIAKEIAFEDPFENMGARLVQEVATKTNDVAGDGTTTATILTEAIVTEGLKNVAAGANPVALRTGIMAATQKVADALKAAAKPVGSDVAHVATVSAQDAVIGGIIAEAVEKIGGGPITTEASQTGVTELEIKEGMRFDQGPISMYFFTDPAKGEAVIEHPTLIITDERISSPQQLLPLIDQLVKSGRKDFVIFAEEVDGEALTMLVMNKLRGIINVVAVKAPGFGDRRTANLADLAVLTGATVISKVIGLELEKATLEHCGSASKVVVTKDSTVVVGGSGSKKKLTERVEQIRQEIQDAKSDFDRERLQERLARLTGGVAVIKVGAATETELKDKKLRIEDAINATRAAIEEGIVAGGGYALLVAREAIKNFAGADADETTGGQIVYRALAWPAMQIAENAGKDGAVVVAESLRQKKGYNAATDTYEDLLKAGVIDPVLVSKSALLNAASVASLLLTTEAAIGETEDKPTEA